MSHQTSPHRTPSNPGMEAVMCWVSGTGRGQAVGHWLSRTLSLPQLRRLTSDAIPWSPLQRPLQEATVALVTTSGVHLRGDRPFKLASDPTFRVIPRTAQASDLAISHQAYDRTDAVRDINLVFPLQRLRELEAEGAIGRVADRHYGFGLVGQGAELVAPGREVGRVEQQRTVLRDMLSMARRAPRPGLVVDLPYRWRRESYPPITDWRSGGEAFEAALARALEATPLREKQGGETGQGGPTARQRFT